MADRHGVQPGGSSRTTGEEEQGGGDEGGGLTEAQTQVLDRCLHALRHAKNDSHTLAALLLVSVMMSRCTSHGVSALPQ